MQKLLFSIISILFIPAVSWGEPGIKPGDRITFLGGTFVERMQIHGHFEAELRTRLGGDIKIRNLGWAGDNVRGESRAVFGTVEDGMDRLLSDMELTRPSVIVICYGGNEAHGGVNGLVTFRDNLTDLVRKLDKFNARYIFVAPRPYENLGPPLPSPSAFNSMLARYASVIQDIAKQNGSLYVDLAHVEPVVTDQVLSSSSENGPWILEDHAGLTSNGVHLTSFGYWRLAGAFADAIGVNREMIRLTTDGNTTGVTGLTFNTKGPTVSIQGTLNQLPLGFGRLIGNSSAIRFSLQVKDLTNPTYVVKSDGNVLGTYSNRQLADGVMLQLPTDIERSNALRESIVNKNMLFFHRHRPQNETYLLLFRKHEQGNNAVEISQFDPLVDNHDRQIYQLTKPSAFTITISPQKP